MPTDETYVHALDVWGAFGPWWMLVAGIVVLLGVLAWRSLPLIDARKKKELSIQEEAQRIRREELALQNKQREDDAANNARFADAMNRTADEPTAPEGGFHAGDLWYQTNADGHIAAVKVWNGTVWNGYDMVANSILVAG